MRWTRSRAERAGDERRREGEPDAEEAEAERERDAPSVGFEDDEAQALLAERRGREAGAVRLPRRHALGLDAPAEKELRAIGRMRQALVRRRGAERERGPRSRIKSADKREDRARQRHAGLNERLGRLREEVRPARVEAVRDAQRELADLDRAYRSLPLVERGVPGLQLAFVEGLVSSVAFFDAFFMKLPLEQAGIASTTTQWTLISGITFVIYGAIHACGIYGGMLGLRLSTRDRRQAATLALGVVALLLVVGFALLGWLRHDWTAHTNRAIEHGTGDRSPLLDLLFLTPLQIAGALGAAAVLSVYQMGDAGRKLRAATAASRGRLRAREQELRATDAEIHERVPNAIERAGLEVHEVRVDKANAEVELAAIQAQTAEQLDVEEHRTDAAVNRYRVEYESTDRKYANGRSRYARHPDGFLRHWRRWVVDDAPDGSAAAREPNGDGPLADQMPLDLHQRG